MTLFPRPQGKPKPVVTWTKGGQPLDPKRVNIRSTERDSIMFIRAAEREDSGVYDMSVKVEGFEDKASLTLQIVGEQNVNTGEATFGNVADAASVLVDTQSCQGLLPA